PLAHHPGFFELSACSGSLKGDAGAGSEPVWICIAVLAFGFPLGGCAGCWLGTRRRAAKLAYDPDPHYTGTAAPAASRCSLGLSVRTSDFQSEKTGSTPVGSANYINGLLCKFISGVNFCNRRATVDLHDNVFPNIRCAVHPKAYQAI